MRALPAFLAGLTLSTPALAHPGHAEVTGSLHAIAHELGGLDMLLTVAALGVAGVVAAVGLAKRAKQRNRRR
jgi:hydrogenase/urease accessory protein HupE